MKDRARGCWLGQIVGDALGTTVEFQSAARIAARYPDGVRDVVGGGPFGLLPGQVTDDTELALALARSLVARRRYDADAVAGAYVAWYRSGPFDVGGTTRRAFGAGGALGPGTAERVAGRASPDSQANGSLMRCSPLGIFGVGLEAGELAALAASDSRLSHPHPLCQAACAVLTHAIAHAIRAGASAADTYAAARRFAETDPRCEPARSVVADAERGPPADLSRQMGWVRIALGNALYQLLAAPSFEEGLIDTVRRGGDTDTNGCIAGALLGAVHGAQAVPDRWRAVVSACQTDRGPTYQARDWAPLADALLEAGLARQGDGAQASRSGGRR